ncbi:MAG: SGNH/GDSL hydrolase family protein [Phycisphaeraceae bacterium JB051]
MSTASKARILLIGDSISVQYTPYLHAALKSQATWVGFSEEERLNALTDLDVPQNLNCGDSSRSLGIITHSLEKTNGQIDLILANCGLHDIKTDPNTGEKQISLEDYQANLKKIVAVAQSYNVPIAWMRTTLVNAQIHNSNCSSFHRYEADLDAYNAAADTIMTDAGYAIIDLWQFTRQLGEDEQLFCDHVHYQDWVRKCQGSYLAGYVQAYLANAAND